MKDWPENHPKAKLIARKRASILDAAREAFLRDGYGRTSMEGIAALAGVSIMTLYRHAENKDDLFSAVIASACHPGDREEQMRLEETLRLPLEEVLAFVGVMFQERMTSPASVALLRTVMAETQRFPQLAEMAYQGLIRDHEDMLDAFLGEQKEATGIGAGQRRKLCADFLDRLLGVDSLRALMGLATATAAEQQSRARNAAKALLAGLQE